MQPQGTPGFPPGLAREGGRATHRGLARAGGHPKGCLCPGGTGAILAGLWSLVHRGERGLWNGHLPGCLWHWAYGLCPPPGGTTKLQIIPWAWVHPSAPSLPTPNHVTKKFQVDEQHGNTTIISEPSCSSKVLPAPASVCQLPQAQQALRSQEMQDQITTTPEGTISLTSPLSGLSREPPSLLHLSVLEPKS